MNLFYEVQFVAEKIKFCVLKFAAEKPVSKFSVTVMIRQIFVVKRYNKYEAKIAPRTCGIITVRVQFISLSELDRT